MSRHIGFLSTRFAGTDGVSLESAKWAQVLWDHKQISYWYAGKLDRDPGVSMLVPETYFAEANNLWINEQVFGKLTRPPEVTKRIFELAEALKHTIYQFVRKFEIDILIVENALCIPMHVPFGVALTHFITETGIPTVAHHHDFYWERTRFSVNSIGDILDMSFPPSSPAIQHVTINSHAQEQLALRKGESSVLVPNVLDFENPPPAPDQYASNFRSDLSLDADDILFLQPTRVVPRKGIEHSISLVAQLREPRCKLIVSHESGDEGHDYLDALQDRAEQEGVDLRFVHAYVGETRSTDDQGKKRYTLADVYQQADFITYPSIYEGFGNALLEAFYYRKPVLVNRYSIYISDIEPRGFRAISMDGYLTRDVLEHVRRVIRNADYRQEMVQHNYELGKAFFSYSVLRRKLRALITNITGLENLEKDGTAMTVLAADTIDRWNAPLGQIYGQPPPGCLAKICQLAERYAPLLPPARDRLWDQRDVVLITYGDQLRAAGQAPLETLRSFLHETGLRDLIRTVHLLPFCPYSSDDGFSVIDYRAVDARLGDWSHIRQLGRELELMFDLVLNHVSQQSDWFQKYLAGEPSCREFFLEVDPAADLSAVTRPRSLPLLTRFQTSRGIRHLWTTFSSDQVDLNYAHPAVLLEMLDILLLYVQQGARIVRLDAVAYLWKEIGSSCIHLPQTHAIVKLLRDLLDALAPGVLLLTETNVPHAENIRYFGQGDEAHMVYQFSLPPLLLDGLLQQDAGPLTDWLAALPPAPPRATFFNFTASHDGVGVRPLEGLVPAGRVGRLVDAVRQRGGRVSTRRTADGQDMPYELNISYVDALGEPGGMEVALHARRFLTSQAVMLALRGVPAVYFHSLVGTRNDQAGVSTTGQARRINRRKFEIDELRRELAAEDGLQARIFRGYRRLLQLRTAQPAFHPDAAQQLLRPACPAVLAFRRVSRDEAQRLLVLANLSGQPQRVSLAALEQPRPARDLLSGQLVPFDLLPLEPYQTAWLEAAG